MKKRGKWREISMKSNEAASVMRREEDVAAKRYRRQSKVREIVAKKYQRRKWQTNEAK
jgi:hypothetical protein